MKTSLVGYTGFVGSNLSESFKFDNLYNSKNIEEAFGTNPDLLIYAGIRAEKFLANKFPQKDMEVIENAKNIIKKINPKKIVLISTIDVYKNPVNVDEDTIIDTDGLQPYGLNRFYLEEWVQENFVNHLIVRLPGLYGENIKKNFIFDLINIIPSMLKEEKFKELCEKDEYIKSFYIDQENGFYKCKELDNKESKKLKLYFNKIGFSALNFTDSRGVFQFYNLKYLWEHINKALENNIKILNLSVEPIGINEIHKSIKGIDFTNEIADVIPQYDYKTKYYNEFGGKNGYIFDKEFVLGDITNFIEERTR